MDAERRQRILDAWNARFGQPGPLLWSRAPGRVNLIGEHTDYNQGYVLPIAIDRDVVVALRPSDSRQVNLVAANLKDEAAFSLVDPKADAAHPWMVYPMGVARILQERGVELPGLDAVFHGTVPMGGGLSSSAALCVAFCLAYCRVARRDFPRPEMARMCQQAEHRFCGVKCGIMDQFVSLHAERGKAVYLDCRDLRHELVPCDIADTRFIICDTRVKHELAASEYNLRREQCEEAAHVLAEFLPSVQSLRDVNVHQFNAYADRVPMPMRKRARHVVTENQRVLAARQAFLDRDPLTLGILMDTSHDSLDEDYEVTCPELNLLVRLARACTGVYGSRMTGGGFGGCTVSLVDAPHVQTFCDHVRKGYQERTDIEPHIYVVAAEQGAEILEA